MAAVYVLSVLRTVRRHAQSLLIACAAGSLLLPSTRAGQLDVSWERVPQDSVVDLTQEGPLDWVHWGLYTESDLNRKANVSPQIENFELIWNVENTAGYAFVWQFADHYNGFRWTDGDPTPMELDTRTGVYAYGTPPLGAGFRLRVAAGTGIKRLKLYVGVFAGRGFFTAQLSDNSAPAYQSGIGPTGALSNIRNGEGAVYTIDFSADSPGQTLIMTWTLAQLSDSRANVTLEAAALSSPGANNPPLVGLTTPGANQQFADGEAVPLQATSDDLDGSVQGVVFYAGDEEIGRASGPLYEAAWQNPPLGPHTLTAVATDDQGAESVSRPVPIFVYGADGSLVGTVEEPPTTVNLTALGTWDWMHWGLTNASNVNRKADVAPVIGGLRALGAAPLERFTNFISELSWQDGTPEPTVSSVRFGVFQYGLDGGFELRMPAGLEPRRARVYVSLYGAHSKFEAYLDDFSAAAYFDTSLSNVFGRDYAVYTLDCRAATPGATLVIRHRPTRLFDLIYGNVTFPAVALSGDGVMPPAPVKLLGPAIEGDIFDFTFATVAGETYAVQCATNLAPGTDPWQTLTNVLGDGQPAWIRQAQDGAIHRFYRVESLGP